MFEHFIKYIPEVSFGWAIAQLIVLTSDGGPETHSGNLIFFIINLSANPQMIII